MDDKYNDPQYKPSARLEYMKLASEERYAGCTPDEKAIATLLNMLHLLGDILDELDERLDDIENPKS